MPDSVWQTIAAIDARPVALGRQYQVEMREGHWNFSSDTLDLRNLPMPALAGNHQVANAAAALAALSAGGFDIQFTRGQVAAALGSVRVPGRFQRIPGEVEWILDVAHNVPAAETLRDNLRRLPRARRTLAICGILGDKDIRGILATLGSEIDAWILVTLAGPRAVGAEQIAEHLPPGASVLARSEDVPAACRVARSSARPQERVLVFGSFLTVGPALEFLGI